MIRTRRWNDPPEPGDGFRLLVARYRPRGVKKEDETWDAWDPALAPSKELHAAYYGKTGEAIGWDEYCSRFLAEMEDQDFRLRALTNRHAEGETITLLCSSHCVDETQCHRTLLKQLIEARAKRGKVHS
jgi:uncharacterized protein YeaO (DUF488 family)